MPNPVWVHGEIVPRVLLMSGVLTLTIATVGLDYICDFSALALTRGRFLSILVSLWNLVLLGLLLRYLL